MLRVQTILAMRLFKL